MKIKLICGFRRDQEHSVDAEEAHKAYYLFLNPDQRGIFKNGLAIIGADIKEIVPDYQGTMGWNSTHILDSDDWNELEKKGIPNKIRTYLNTAQEVAALSDPKDMQAPLSELVEKKYPQLAPKTTERREIGMKSIGEITDVNNPVSTGGEGVK